MSSVLFLSRQGSPLGDLWAISDANQLMGLFFHRAELEDWLFRHHKLSSIEERPDLPVLLDLKVQLRDYFNKNIQEFSLPLKLEGRPFQLRVWKNLQKIPYGTTWSYQQLARAVKNPRAMRAVGSANGRNPLPIIIPCHRVIRKNGDIGGYSSGLAIKRWLLQHEGINL
jgi:methylated-DNA-[protein]-cysteine S-methyltransferase